MEEGFSLLDRLNAGISVKADALTALTKQREDLTEAESLYTALYGGGTLDVQALVKKFGPMLAKYGILPAGLLTAADSGAFSGVFDALGKVLGLFGLG